MLIHSHANRFPLASNICPWNNLPSIVTLDIVLSLVEILSLLDWRPNELPAEPSVTCIVDGMLVVFGTDGGGGVTLVVGGGGRLVGWNPNDVPICEICRGSGP